jgi:hypothetical protein
MVALWLPAGKPVGSAETVRVEGVVPDSGLTLNQLALDAAVNESALPLLFTTSDCDASCGPPMVWLK